MWEIHERLNAFVTGYIKIISMVCKKSKVETIEKRGNQLDRWGKEKTLKEKLFLHKIQTAFPGNVNGSNSNEFTVP